MKHANQYLNDNHIYNPLLDALVDVGAISLDQKREADKALDNYAKQAKKRVTKLLAQT